MCGYGGYPDIARLLLEHGASLDNVDIDGDTPLKLANNRGHRAVVEVFEEYMESHDRKVREMDDEKPRSPEDIFGTAVLV